MTTPDEFTALESDCITIGFNSAVRTFQIHPEVRYRSIGIHIPPILQQAWVCIETGEVEWRDVPTAPIEEPDI